LYRLGNTLSEVIVVASYNFKIAHVQSKNQNEFYKICNLFLGSLSELHFVCRAEHIIFTAICMKGQILHQLLQDFSPLIRPHPPPPTPLITTPLHCTVVNESLFLSKWIMKRHIIILLFICY